MVPFLYKKEAFYRNLKPLDMTNNELIAPTQQAGSLFIFILSIFCVLGFSS